MFELRNVRVRLYLPLIVLFWWLLLGATCSEAAVGFYRSLISDSSKSNYLLRTPVRGLSAFQDRAILDLRSNLVGFRTESDSLFTQTRISYQIAGVDLLPPTTLTYPEYAEMRMRYDLWKTLREERMKTYKQVGRQAGGQGVAIDVPFRIKSKTFRRLFGGDNVGVRVQGNIAINGNIRRQKFDELQAANQRNTNTNFRIDMTQQFTITGKVGQKVEVRVDQDSERPFDFENTLKLTYTGSEDEIVQKVEAGNVNLNLSGPRLATFSGRNTGLFGLKAETKFGPLNITSIASLERGQKQKQSPRTTTQRGQFSEKQFLQNVYFWITNTSQAGDGRAVGNFRENYRRYQNRQHVAIDPSSAPRFAIADIEVYVSTTAQQATQTEIFGRATSLQYIQDLSVPDSVFARMVTADHEHAVAIWRKLNKQSDYDFEPQLGYIRLRQAVQQGQMLACAFSTVQGDTFGTLKANLDTLALVLLRWQDPSPSDSTWSLMFRHVYYVGANNLDPAKFKLNIVRDAASGQRDETGPPGSNETYLQFFRFDLESQGGAPGADGNVDNYPALMDFRYGELHFLDLTPFNPSGYWDPPNANEPTIWGLANLDATVDSGGFLAPYLYDTKVSQHGNQGVRWRFTTEFSGTTSTFDLGPLVLEGSEEVTLNGAHLQRGVDYTIDYLSGQLKILNEAAKAPGANLEITYETGRTLQLDKTTLLGTRAEYGLWKDSYIGGMVLYLNQKTLDRRVRIGSEPIRNTLYDLNTRLKFQPNFITRAIDAMPLIRTDASSDLTLEGEYAMVQPNPNSLENPRTGDYNGLAFLDDFEGARRPIPLGLNRRMWTIASIPLDARIDSARGRFRWWNPNTRDQVPVKDVWPDREVNSQVAQTTQSILFDFQPDTVGGHPERSWGGVMRYLGEGFADQSRSQYLEFWINLPSRPEGELVVDLGTISEDALPNDTMDSEDQPLPGQVRVSVQREYGNGLLTPEEDTGLDGKFAADPNDSAYWNGPARPPIPSWDDWAHAANSSDFTQINGTERSRNDESGGYPDTEDLNNNDFLDGANDYYSFRIPIRENSPYIVGGNFEKRWRLFRVPIRREGMVGDTAVGRPDLTSVRWARVYITGCTRPMRLELVQMDIVSNEWLPVVTSGDSTEYVQAAVINTHENPGYESPPGVLGEIDPITNLRSREQSLVLKIQELDNLPDSTSRAPSQFFLAKNLYQETNLLEYRKLKMFVHGGGEDVSRFPDGKYQIILRLGQNYSRPNNDCFEIIRTVHPGWDRNSIEISLNDLSLLHSQRAAAGLGSERSRFAIATDTTRFGDSLAIDGNPTLQRIGFIALGVRLLDKHLRGYGDEIWVDELRVTDIYKDAGTAVAASGGLNLADFIAVTGSYQSTDADFHNVNVRINQSQSSTRQMQGNLQFNLHKVAVERWGFRLPVSVGFSESNSIPRMLPSTGLRIDPEHAPDSIKAHQTQFNYRVSYSKGGNARNPFVRWTLEKLSLSYDFAKDQRRDFNVASATNENSSAQAGYTFPTAKGRGVAPLFWIKRIPVLRVIGSPRLYYKPTKVVLSAQGTKRDSYQASRPTYQFRNDSTIITQQITSQSQFNTSRSINVGFAPFDPITVDYTRSHKGLLASGGWDKLLQYDFGRPTEVNQSFSTSYSPEFAAWLRPTVTYTSGYAWGNRNFTQANQQAVSNQRNLGADWQLDFRQIFGGGGGRGRDRDRGRSNNRARPGMPGDPRRPGDPGFPRSPEGDFPKPEDGGNKPPAPGPDGQGPGAGDPPSQPPSEPPARPQPGRPPMDSLGLPGMRTPRAPLDDSLQVPMSDSARARSGASKAAPREKRRLPIFSVLSPIKKALLAIDPIALSYDNTAQHQQSGTIGQADLKYQFGLTQNPQVATAEGYVSAPTRRQDANYTARSGLKITRNIKASFNYGYRTGENISTTSTGSIEQTMFWLGGVKQEKINTYPMPDISVDWSGLEKFRFLNRIAESVALQSGVGSKLRSDWQGNSSNVRRRGYTRQWNPLLGVNFGWKRGIDSQVRYNTGRTIDEDVQLGGRSRSNDKTISGTISYSIRTGFRLPLLFMKPLRLQNQTTFSMNVEYRQQKQERKESGRTDEYSIQGAQSSWSLQPRMTYSFSNTVQGQGYLQIQQTKNEVTQAKSRLFEFGIQVNISIRG